MTRSAIASLILAVLALVLALLALCGGAATSAGPPAARVGELDTACAASECLTCYRACPRCEVRR